MADPIWAHAPIRSLLWDVLDSNAFTRQDQIRIVQLAWLLLLSIYEGDAEASCCDRQSNGDASMNLLSLTVDKSFSFAEHLTRIRTTNTGNPDTQLKIPGTMLWQGRPEDVQKSICTGSEILRHKAFDMILVLDGFSEGEPYTERSLDLLYHTSIMRAQSATDRIETFKSILMAVTSFPMRSIRDADLLSLHDKRRIIAWNHPGPDPPLDMTIVSGFARNVEEAGDAPAIFAWDGEMTYRELDATSSEIASFLVRALDGPNEMVLFNMRKSKWALVAALAILKAGKAIVPLDPDWPRSRLDQIIGLTKATIAVCDEETASTFNPFKIETVIVPSVSNPEIMRHNRGSVKQANCDPDDLAFVLFSSGSTGVPKGMLRQHNTACTGSFAHAKAMHLDRSSRVLQFANHVFDVAMLDFFTTLLVGGCVCIPSESDRKNDLAAFVEKSQANWALLTPTVAALLEPANVPSLRFVTLGGESINKATLQKWLKSCRVGINYGSAEVDVTHARDVLDDGDTANVGRRLASCTAYIVDPENPDIILPVGAVGELTVSGPTMAREYLHAPSKTAAAFLSSPRCWIAQGIRIEHEQQPWMSRIYRMGDLFRQEEDGSFCFVGRRDFQVKVNGQKVELGDVESKLVQHTDIQHCAVLYPETGPYAKRLVVFVERVNSFSRESRHSRIANGTGSTLTLRVLTEFLQNFLPSFMLPRVLIVVERMVFTPSMKIDRNRLKQWLSQDDGLSDLVGGVVHVSTALEGPSLSLRETKALEISNLVANIIAAPGSEIWKAVDRHDNRLHDIGLDSAQMMRLASSIHRQYQAKVMVETLNISDMTIRRLAELVVSSTSELNGAVASDPRTTKVQRLQDRVARHSQSVLRTNSNRLFCSRHVFLTGATGYLGVRILLHLLKSSNIDSVTVLVRSSDSEQALKRVKHALEAVGAGSNCNATLDAWTGDLSQKQLGLSDEHWRQLAGGMGERGLADRPNIDTIVHCGAVVDWIRSYDELEPANVKSTEQLLQLMVMSAHIKSFIFISGGQYPDPAKDDTRDVEAMYATATQGSAYAQTKFVAERMVDKVRLSLPNKSISIVSPAYLIGGRQDGLANQDDYLWRVVWATVRARAFNAEEQDQWLFVSEVDAVAERILSLILQPARAGSSMTLRVHGGLAMSRFWQLISEVLGIRLAAQAGEVWLEKIRRDMERHNHHLLWPLSDALNASSGKLTNGRCLAADMSLESEPKSIELAVRRNVDHLHRVGFFSTS